MADPIVVNLYWQARNEATSRLVHRIYVLLTALRGIDPELAGWQFADRSGGDVEQLDGKDSVQKALDLNEVTWKTGTEKRTSYQPFFFIGDPARPDVDITVTCGITVPAGMERIFLPNRIAMKLQRYAGEEGLTSAMVDKIMRAAINGFQPDFGYAGTRDRPLPPLAMRSDGTPKVGWITFLSSRYPAPPTRFEAPSVVHAVGKHGHLIVAHPKLFDPSDSEQLEAIQRVEERLRDAEVLLPFVKIAGR